MGEIVSGERRLSTNDLNLRAARAALDGGGESFDLLDAMLRENDSYAARMKSRYAETGCIMDCISGQYSY